jgi:hypothetical protein
MTEINECLSNPCQNNATCIDQIGRYACACPKSFAGHQCEYKVKQRGFLLMKSMIMILNDV